MSDNEPEPHPRRALVGLALMAVFILAVLFVMYRLHEAARLQDCVASGRTNCMPIETPGR